jgi:GrpB-like predicted nucleotidyltransferase (UPF0157 family)
VGKGEEGRGKIERYEHAPAVYREWDPQSPTVARAVGDLIEAAMPESVVEHVGSTAVPGLGGKGVLDLALIYPPGQIASARDALHSLGFQRQTTRDPFPEERPMRVGSIQWNGSRYRLHVHVISADSAEVHDLLTFRDSLRADAERRDAYAQLKRGILAGGVTDSLDYWKAKSEFFGGRESWRSAMPAEEPRTS